MAHKNFSRKLIVNEEGNAQIAIMAYCVADTTISPKIVTKKRPSNFPHGIFIPKIAYISVVIFILQFEFLNTK